MKIENKKSKNMKKSDKNEKTKAYRFLKEFIEE